MAERAKKEQESEESGSSNDQKKTIDQQSEGEGGLQKKEENAKDKETFAKERVSQTKVFASFIRHSIISNYFINTQTDVSYLSLGFEKSYLLDEWRSNLWGGGRISLGSVMSELEQEVSSYYSLDFFLRQVKAYSKFNFEAQLSIEALNFVNLPQTRQGLQASQNSIFWANFIIEYESLIFERKGIYFFTLGKSLYAISDYNNLDSGLGGWQVRTGFRVENIYKIVGAQVSMGLMSLTSTLQEDIDSDGIMVNELSVKNNIIEFGVFVNF